MDVLLVDLSHLFRSAWHAGADKEVSFAYDSTVRQVQHHADGYDRVAICVDAPPYWRKERFPEYKANREAQDPALFDQLRRTIERLELDGHVIWRAQGFEADDVIASAVHQSTDERITILTGDKDLMQLVDDRVGILSTRTGERFGAAEVFDKYGVAPSKIRDWLALQGDKSDNVPGIPKVGPKTAAKLLAQFDDVNSVSLAARDGHEALPARLAEAIITHRDTLAIAVEMVTLRRDAPIDWNDVHTEREIKPMETRSYTEGDFEEVPDSTTDNEAPEAAANEAPKSEPRNKKPDALAKVAPSWDLALEPSSVSGAYKLAEILINSRLYNRYSCAEAICATIIRGRELGLGALTALDVFHIMEGKPVMHAHFIIARGKAHPDCEYFQVIESTPTSCTIETKNRRNKQPTRHTYTLAQAQQAGICPIDIRTAPIKDPQTGKDSRGQWEKRPAEMLYKTCGVQLTRMEYPDAALGLYCPEEMGYEVAV